MALRLYSRIPRDTTMDFGDVTGLIAIALSLWALYQGWQSDKTTTMLIEKLSKPTSESQIEWID